MKKDKDSISYPLSTIGPDGGPKTRFVLHRGFVKWVCPVSRAAWSPPACAVVGQRLTGEPIPNCHSERRKEEDPSSNPLGDESEGKVGEVLLSTTDIRCVQLVLATSALRTAPS